MDLSSAAAWYSGPVGAVRGVVMTWPLTTAVVVAVLVLLVIVLSFYVNKYRPHKAHFLGQYTGNHSNWHHGGLDAGDGGTMDSAPHTPTAALTGDAHPDCGSKRPVYGPDGKLAYCAPSWKTPDMSLCGQAWDPVAAQEAATLAAVGGFAADDATGEAALQAAAGYSDEALTQIMHNGGMP